MGDIQKPPAADLAYNTIRTKILSGELSGGQRLTEQGVASDLGLSRTPIRDAISRLTHEGFIERGQGYNTRVRHFLEGELEQVFEIRRRLESYAAGRAAQLATPEEIEELQQLSDLMLSHTPPKSDEDYQIISEANHKFHGVIYEAARSPRLKAILSLTVDVGVVAKTYYNYSDADLIRSAQHHKELTEAIAAGSSNWAESVMSTHVLAAAVSVSKLNKNDQNSDT